MDLKRSRDLDDGTSSPHGKRARLDAASLAANNAMQVVAHEALAMTDGAGFSAVNKIRVEQAAFSGRCQGDDNSPSSGNETDFDDGHDYTIFGVNGTSNGNGNGNDCEYDRGHGHGHAQVDPATHKNGAIDTGTGHGPFASMSDVTRSFQDAVLKGWDRRSPTYARVNVLLIYWEVDGSAAADAAARLETIFRTLFHYATDTFVIRSAAQSAKLYGKVESLFAKCSSPDHLSIVYYGGQTAANPMDGPPIWTPRQHANNASGIESKPIQAAYEGASCDVLLLSDSCSTNIFPLTNATCGVARRTAIEVLDAPLVATDQIYASLSKALAEELAAVASDGPLCVRDLHTQIVHRMNASKPRGRGRPPKDPPAKVFLDPKHLPKHAWLFRRRSIVLAPQPEQAQVVICLRVLNGSLDVNQWGKWIYNAPFTARDAVKIEGLYSGFSTMIVLRIPASKWDFFARCPTGSLVGYTTIGDIETDLLDKIDRELASKLWAEDVPLSRYLAGSAASPTSPTGGGAAFVRGPTSSGPIAVGPDGLPAPVRDDVTADLGVSGASADGDTNGGVASRPGQKKTRKALPTERRILPSEASLPPFSGRRKDFAPRDDRSSKTGRHHQQQERHLKTVSRRQGDTGDTAENGAELAAAAQRPLKISIKSAGQTHLCKECKVGFKDSDSLHNHVRKQHTRPFHCVFNWAGCESTFASKNEWKRHVLSQHILLQYWVCQVELCSKVVNKAPGSSSNDFSLPNGAIFNRKDLFTQHLRRMHTPPGVRRLLKQAKQMSKAANSLVILEWENHLKELQRDGLKPRCRLPEYMMCPARDCGVDFHGPNAWDDRMEHVARHLEAAAAGREPAVIFGGKTDPTLTDWATQPEVGIAKRVGPDVWHLDNPLRPEIMAWTDNSDEDQSHTLSRSTKEREKSELRLQRHGKRQKRLANGKQENEVERWEDENEEEEEVQEEEVVEENEDDDDDDDGGDSKNENDEGQRQTKPEDGDSRDRSKSVIEVADQNRKNLSGNSVDSGHTIRYDEDKAVEQDVTVKTEDGL
ncbi:hmg-i/hmg-y, DNA-binding protein [Niveomyces insectorum RCEF 264]|uniref:Hmg-i/hmg-y, DNA-binding protein n=1 Tax=Niveomyces insectorum RCEF 264 TaxID=1081102 RepID=A0A167ZBN4_9HYPO|nr:hmg-i/hmg-y, DNA-binding protein [Niveomyces insectorum RCEF 264]